MLKMSNNAWGKPSETDLRPREFVMPQKSLDSENEIPTIPDVDELNEASKDAASTSSKISSGQTSTYQGLDSELLKQNSFVALDGINLGPLFKFFHPDVNVKESDTEWTIDSLFKDLAEYYQSDTTAQ